MTRRRGGEQVEVAAYGRNGKLRRRTVTLYPPAPTPPNVEATAFDEIDAQLERYVADLNRLRAELDRQNPPRFLAAPAIGAPADMPSTERTRQGA